MLLIFGEPAAKVAANVRSQGFGLDELQRDRLLAGSGHRHSIGRDAGRPDECWLTLGDSRNDDAPGRSTGKQEK